MCYLSLVIFLAAATSCAAASKNIQPQINSLVAANHYDRALTLLGDDPSVYGPHNHLLFWLDKGLAAHLAGRTKPSVAAFEQAEKLYEALYTKSISQMANTWIVNDTKEDYRGDEQEYVMVNVFQALNFAEAGNFEEALVEARRMDQKLKNIGARYQNPFAYFLSGLLWQVSGEPNANEDASIDYQKAAAIYESTPKVLKDLMQEAKDVSRGLRHLDKARVYVVEYTGFIPVKVADALAFPLDRTHLTKISFPRYQDRFSEVASSQVKISRGGVAYVQPTEVVCDLGKLARKILEGHKAAIVTKASIRPLLKYGVEKAIEIPLRDKAGDLAADLFGIAGSIYNLATEEADLRTWQSLPEMIRIVYFDLDPGVYDIAVEDMAEDNSVTDRKNFQSLELRAGDVKFIVSRSRF